MAIVTSSSTRNSDALINYVLDDKADQKNERYVMATGTGGLLVSVAKAQFRGVRKNHGKEQYVWKLDAAGRYVRQSRFVQGYHVIQSFAQDELDPDSPDAWLRAQELGRGLAEDRFPGRQCLVVTQRDGKTGCLHNHIVVNSVDTVTGKSLDSSIVMHAKLAAEHDRVLAEHGFVQRGDLQEAMADAQERAARGEPSRLRRGGERDRRELKESQRYVVWEAECDVADDMCLPRNPEPFSAAVLKHRIDLSLADPDAVDWDSFVVAGAKHGVRIATRGTKGAVTYGMMREQSDGSLAEPSASDTRRSTSMGQDMYGLAAVETTLGLKTSAGPQTTTPAPENATTALEGKAPTVDVDGTEARQPEQDEQQAAIDAALADRVIVDVGLQRFDMREANKTLMALGGMSTAELRAAVDAWESLGKPETARERASREATEALAAAQAQTDLDEGAVGAPSAPAPVAVQPEAEPEPDLAAMLLPFDDDLPVAQPASTKLKPSAPAPDFSRVPGAAPALPVPVEPEVPAEDEAPYVSKLRGHRTKNPKTQSVVDAMAVFDENAREALLRGERVRESDIPKGVGPNFLQALGDKLDPLVFEQLQLREAKKARANRFYDAGKRAAEKLTELGKLAEQQGDLTGMWQFDTRAQELAAERDLANRKLKSLREQIAAGVYEEVQGTAWKTRAAVANTQEQPEIEPRSL